MKSLGCVLLILLSCSCSQEKEGAQQMNSFEKYFSNFPSSPFLNLSFNQPLIGQKKLLTDQGFEFDDETFGKNPEGVELFLGQTEKLLSLKVLFFSQNERDFKKKTTFFKEKSTKSNISDQFATFDFETTENRFSLTLFMYESMIRMQFLLQSSH